MPTITNTLFKRGGDDINKLDFLTYERSEIPIVNSKQVINLGKSFKHLIGSDLFDGQFKLLKSKLNYKEVYELFIKGVEESPIQIKVSANTPLGIFKPSIRDPKTINSFNSLFLAVEDIVRPLYCNTVKHLLDVVLPKESGKDTGFVFNVEYCKEHIYFEVEYPKSHLHIELSIDLNKLNTKI
jgi:hypothetical protein